MRPNGGADRQSERQVSLLTNGVTWYLRSSIFVSDDRLRVETPHTILGFIPIGTKRLDADLGHVRGSSLGPHLYPGRLAVAFGLLVAAFVLDWSPLAVSALVAGAAMLLLSVIAVMRIDQVGGERFLVPVCLAHLGRASRVVEAVNSSTRSRTARGITP